MSREKITRTEFKRKMKQVWMHFDKIDIILNSLPKGIQDEIQEYHNSEGTLGHCTRWGLQGSMDLYKDAKNFLKKAEENGSI